MTPRRWKARTVWPSADPSPELADEHNALVEAYEQRDARVVALEQENIELRRRVSPEVERAARYICDNADKHPDACCPECGKGLAERDRLAQENADLRAKLATLEGAIREDCLYCDGLLDELKATQELLAEFDDRIGELQTKEAEADAEIGRALGVLYAAGDLRVTHDDDGDCNVTVLRARMIYEIGDTLGTALLAAAKQVEEGK